MVGLSETVVEAIRAMDEHWDGGGYPYKLRATADAAAGADHRAGAGRRDLLVATAGRTAPSTSPASGAAAGSIPSSSTRSSRPPANRDFWTGLSDARLDRDLLTLVPAGLEIPTDDALLDRIADAFALIIDAKSPFTFEHSARVADYALAINDRLGDRAVEPVRLRRAALLHDIGKLTVPNTILDKPARLDPSERAVVEQHPAYTLSLLQRVPVFSAFADDAANHHEWVDGRGYCRGLTRRGAVDDGAHPRRRRRARRPDRRPSVSRRPAARPRAGDSRQRVGYPLRPRVRRGLRRRHPGERDRRAGPARRVTTGGDTQP